MDNNGTMKLAEVHDKNGVLIQNGSTIIYNGKFYMVMSVGKDNVGFICHPIGNNDGNDILLDDIVNQVEVASYF